MLLALFQHPGWARSGRMLARFYWVLMMSFGGVFEAVLTPLEFRAILCENNRFQGHDRGLSDKFAWSFQDIFALSWIVLT